MEEIVMTDLEAIVYPQVEEGLRPIQSDVERLHTAAWDTFFETKEWEVTDEDTDRLDEAILEAVNGLRTLLTYPTWTRTESEAVGRAIGSTLARRIDQEVESDSDDD